MINPKEKTVDEVINEVWKSLQTFCRYGYSEPIIHREAWATSFVLRHSKIAVEVEIDWREYFCVFVYVVMLEEGKLPSGYYVSNGRTCRRYLEEVIKDLHWKIDAKAMEKILPPKTKKESKEEAMRRMKERSKEMILENFYAYKHVLDQCIEQIIVDEDRIFQN